MQKGAFSRDNRCDRVPTWQRKTFLYSIFFSTLKVCHFTMCTMWWTVCQAVS